MVDEQTMSLYLPVTNNPTNTLTCKLCSMIKFVIKHSPFITSISLAVGGFTKVSILATPRRHSKFISCRVSAPSGDPNLRKN